MSEPQPSQQLVHELLQRIAEGDEFSILEST